MELVARFPEQDRKDLFLQTAEKMRLSAGNIEKDFWVCWVLDALFSSETWSNKLIFKGGTSLSKIFHLINRFSEDIDLILDWQQLGIAKDVPWENRSKTQQDKFCDKIRAETSDYIAHTFVPSLGQELAQKLQADIGMEARDDTVIIAYPKTLSVEYVRPEIRLEIGPLANWVPHGKFPLSSYAAEHFPQFFKKRSSTVVAILAERTFWEKATILHEQASSARILPNYSRHYYDLAQMAGSDVKLLALGNLDLLHEVIEFKDRFYRSNKARYDLAVPGTFRLMPSPDLLPELEKDYRRMGVMLFGAPPEFESIISTLRKLEGEINSL